VLVFIIKNNFWSNAENTPARTNVPVKQNNSEREEKVAAEYSDGLQEVHVYNKKTGEGIVVYRKEHEIERRTRNIRFVQKTTTPNFDSPKDYDNFMKREQEQKKRIQDFIKSDVRREQRELQKQRNEKYKRGNN
jgi:hypothetical protein